MSKLTVFNPLNVPADPTNANEVADKNYIDNVAALKMPVAGGTFTGPIKVIPVQLVADGSNQFTLDATASNVFRIDLSASGTLLNPTNTTGKEGQVIHLMVKNTGAFTLTFQSKYWFPGGSDPTITSGSNKYDLIVMIANPLDPSVFLCYAYQNFL